MQLETMQPNPAWDSAAHQETVEVLSEDGLKFSVWAGDWCPDCRGQLPDFAAALRAASVSSDRITQYPVEKNEDGSKTGPAVSEYEIELIPTVVVERDDEEIARFVEEEQMPIPVHLAEEIASY